MPEEPKLAAITQMAFYSLIDRDGLSIEKALHCKPQQTSFTIYTRHSGITCSGGVVLERNAR